MRLADRFHAIDCRSGGVPIIREGGEPERLLIEADDGDAILRPQQRLRELLRRGADDRQLFEHRLGVIDEEHDVQRLIGGRNERFDFARLAFVEEREVFDAKRLRPAGDRNRDLLEIHVDATAHVGAKEENVVRFVAIG